MEQIADQLSAFSADMAAQRDPPMGRHDMRIMMSAAPVAAFAKYVQSEEELLALLQESVAQNRRVLGGMQQASGDADPMRWSCGNRHG